MEIIWIQILAQSSAWRGSNGDCTEIYLYNPICNVCGL